MTGAEQEGPMDSPRTPDAARCDACDKIDSLIREAEAAQGAAPLPPCPICGKPDLFIGTDGKPGCPHCEVAVRLPSEGAAPRAEGPHHPECEKPCEAEPGCPCLCHYDDLPAGYRKPDCGAAPRAEGLERRAAAATPSLDVRTLAAAGTMRFDPVGTDAIIEARLAAHGIDYEYIAEFLTARLARLDEGSATPDNLSDLSLSSVSAEGSATPDQVWDDIYGEDGTAGSATPDQGKGEPR